MGSTAAPAVVRRALAPNPAAPGGTKQWANSSRHEWAARARPTAPEAGALPKPTASFRLRASNYSSLATLPRSLYFSGHNVEDALFALPKQPAERLE